MEIPHEQIPSDLLVSLIESFIMREGTDYGHGDYSMEEKVEQVLRQLRAKKVIITFDQETESFNIVSKQNGG